MPLFLITTASNNHNPTEQLVAWTDSAWDDYLHWQEKDKKKLKRINMLIKDIKRSNFSGIGKPESLKHDLSEYWSRRIDRKHRIIYIVIENLIIITSCSDHY